MKYIITGLMLLLNVWASYSQIDFRDDCRSMQSEYADYSLWNKEADKKLKLKDDYDFEFRMWTTHSLTDHQTLFVLRLKGMSWSAKYIEYESRKDKWKEKTVSNEGLDKVWMLLERNKILTLPTQDSIRYKMKIYEADTARVFYEPDDLQKRIHIVDGTGYRFELRKKDKQRAYNYHCPAHYLKYFPNVEELYRAYAIIAIVRRHLGLPLDFC